MKAAGTIYVVDDVAVVRASTTSLLLARGDLEVREFVSGAALLAVLDHLDPGCVILDLQRNGASGARGAAVMAALACRPRDFRTIVVTSDGDIGTAVEAFRAGAVDFFYRPCERRPLMEAIDRALHLLEHGKEPPHLLEQMRSAMARLDEAQSDLLRSLVRGLTNHEIAVLSGTDEPGVRMARGRLLATLEAPSLLAAVRMAMIVERAAA